MPCFDEEDYREHCRPRPPRNTHNHEVQGSVEIAGPQGRRLHNHRFCTVSGEAIPVDGGNDHIHRVEFTTDSYEGHYHRFSGRTGGAIRVGDRHVHYLESVTSEDADHKHRFRVGTQIDDPIGD